MDLVAGDESELVGATVVLSVDDLDAVGTIPPLPRNDESIREAVVDLEGRLLASAVVYKDIIRDPSTAYLRAWIDYSGLPRQNVLAVGARVTTQDGTTVVARSWSGSYSHHTECSHTCLDLSLTPR